MTASALLRRCSRVGWILTGWVASQMFAFLAPPARTTGRSCVLPPILWLGLFLPSAVAFVFRPVPVTDAVTVAGRTFLTALAQLLSQRRTEVVE
ncbi:hypothetical protein [Mycolicibacterium sp. S2-37]|uniref:hypothetical protein n=1 Tax=Mycolicibacterium sp. S2-37 TaxID=2810297 RepID=UPI001F5EE5F6|nr:hypothetical protein [Mycolicibacterium sp. S2-37]